MLFFKVAESFYIPPAMYESLNFSTSLPTHIIICLVYSHLTDIFFLASENNILARSIDTGSSFYFTT